MKRGGNSISAFIGGTVVGITFSTTVFLLAHWFGGLGISDVGTIFLFFTIFHNSNDHISCNFPSAYAILPSPSSSSSTSLLSSSSSSSSLSSSVSLVRRKKELPQCDDDCQSFFYPIATLPEVGVPHIKTCDESTIKQLTTVHPEFRHLPLAMYRDAVANMVICCVDVLCQRRDGKLLLFYRRDAPASHIWWWPGGRMLRGETFFAAARRKLMDETGYRDKSKIKPIGVVGAWNTFFPTSAHDSGRKKGYEGTQTVNITVVVSFEGDDRDLEMNEAAKVDYAVEKHRWVTVKQVLHDAGRFDKYVRVNVECAVNQGLLSTR